MATVGKDQNSFLYARLGCKQGLRQDLETESLGNLRSNGVAIQSIVIIATSVALIIELSINQSFFL